MDYIRITAENIDREHICCAMSNKQSVMKKEWMKRRFAEGLVFYRSVERGKCFIEYIPAENAWVPIEAPGYIYINCLWVSGSMKGHGYSNELLDECIRDARSQGRRGLCILSSAKKKKEFLADPRYLAHKGFMTADESVNDITLMYLPLGEGAEPPRFRPCAKSAHTQEEDLLVIVQDDGEGMRPERLDEIRRALEEEAPDSGQIGLRNIHRRIRLSCGEKYGLTIDSAPRSGTKVTVRLPAGRAAQAGEEATVCTGC